MDVGEQEIEQSEQRRRIGRGEQVEGLVVERARPGIRARTDCTACPISAKLPRPPKTISLPSDSPATNSGWRRAAASAAAISAASLMSHTPMITVW